MHTQLGIDIPFVLHGYVTRLNAIKGQNTKVELTPEAKHLAIEA
jgi:hypothetical protein